MKTKDIAGKPQPRAQAALRLKPPRKPGRLERAARRRTAAAARAALPYSTASALTLIAAEITGSELAAGLGLGATAMHAGIRLHEAHGWHRSGGKAAMRRRRKFQGWAGRRDIARLSRLGPRDRHPLLHLGTARQRAVAVHREKSVLYVGPPGCGKTAALACHAADAPGLLFATSTKTELLLDTAGYRHGVTWVLNADGYGGIASTLCWSPLDGCRNPQAAKRRAGAFAHASPKGRGGDDSGYWTGSGAGLIAVMLHAAALTPGATMREVTAWCRNPWDPDIKAAYALPGADQMLATKYASLIGGEGEHLNGIIGAAEAALAWMDDPVMAAIACPAPGGGFSPRRFARSTDSAYLIGRKRPYDSMAPYFAALGEEVFEQLRAYAMEAASGRLPVPATFVLDEMPLTCPLPVHDMLADSRGYLITIAAGAQSLSQLRSVWGADDADTIRSATPVEVFFGGESRDTELEAVSKVIGERDTWHHVRHQGGGKTRQPDKEPLMPLAELRQLGERQAVILAPGCKAIRARTPAIWERPGHVRADLAVFSPAAVEQPAIEPPHREPVTPPPAFPPAILATMNGANR